MIFSKERYINAIEHRDTIAILRALATIAITIIIAFIINTIIHISLIILILLALIIGMCIAYNNYINEQTKIEEMKMKLDIYEKIVNK